MTLPSPVPACLQQDPTKPEVPTQCHFLLLHTNHWLFSNILWCRFRSVWAVHCKVQRRTLSTLWCRFHRGLKFQQIILLSINHFDIKRNSPWKSPFSSGPFFFVLRWSFPEWSGIFVVPKIVKISRINVELNNLLVTINFLVLQYEWMMNRQREMSKKIDTNKSVFSF